MSALEIETKSSLIDKLKDLGNQAGWLEFYAKYRPFLAGVAMRSRLSREEVEEVLQDTVISLAKQMPDFEYDRSKGEFRGWLSTIVKRRVVDCLRRRARQAKAETSLYSNLEQDGVFDESFESIWEEEWKGVVKEIARMEVLKRVSSKQYQIYDWYVLRGHPKRLVCEKFGVTGNVVDIAKSRVGKVMEEEIKKFEEGIL